MGGGGGGKGPFIYKVISDEGGSLLNILHNYKGSVCVCVFGGASVKLVTIKISHCYNVYRKGCNSYKQCVVSILLQHVFVVTILLQHIILVTMRIGCNNVKIKYLLLQRLRIVVTQILVATMNGICYNWQIFGRDLFDMNLWGAQWLLPGLLHRVWLREPSKKSGQSWDIAETVSAL